MIDKPVDLAAWKKRTQALQQSLHALDAIAEEPGQSRQQSKAAKANPSNKKAIPAAQSLIP